MILWHIINFCTRCQSSCHGHLGIESLCCRGAVQFCRSTFEAKAYTESISPCTLYGGNAKHMQNSQGAGESHQISYNHALIQYL